jgi:hypothetical protein
MSNTRSAVMAVIVFLFGLSCMLGNAQASDAQAVTLAQAAQLAVTSGTAVSDIVVATTANVVINDKVVPGAVTLKARGLMEARIDVTAGPLTRSEIRNDTAGPAGAWVGADGKPHPMALQNCFGIPAWFAPYAITGALNGSDVVLTYVGHENRNGVAVDHIRFERKFPFKNARIAADAQQLSAADVFLDVNSHLPVDVIVYLRFDKDTGQALASETRFADYRAVSGVLVPYRIQNLFQNHLTFDLNVSSVMVNSGLTDSDFSLQ